MPFQTKKLLYWAAQQNSSSATKAQNEGRFPSVAATNSDSECAGAGSGERRDETKANALLIQPRPLSITTASHRAKRTTTNNERNAPPPLFVRPPVGRRVLRHDRNTHKCTRASADRSSAAAVRPHCRLVSCVVVGRSVSDAHATAATSASPRLKMRLLRGRKWRTSRIIIALRRNHKTVPCFHFVSDEPANYEFCWAVQYIRQSEGPGAR